MGHVTAATCDYGLARTHEGCVRTLASFGMSEYRRLQVTCLCLGLVALAVSVYKYVVSVRRQCAKLQQRCFAMCIYISMTFLIRAIDPSSYAHFVPRVLMHYIVETATLGIYTVFIMSLCFWVSIIHKGAGAPPELSRRLRIFEWTAIALMWLFKTLVNLSLFWTKGFNVYFITIDLIITAIVLFVISVAFGVYGLRVIRRLEYIDKMNSRRLSFESQFETLQTGRTDIFATNRSTMTILELDGDATPVIAPKSIPRPPLIKAKPARKIKQMLILCEVFALVSVGLQIYSAVERHDNSKELDCANGVGCKDLRVSLTCLQILQYVAIWCILFTFRKTKKRDAANEFGLSRPVQIT